MKLQSILSLVVLILLATGCRKDISETSTSNPIVPNPEYTYESSVSGIVVDNNALAIANASVTMGDDVTTTDVNGFFKFRDVLVDKAGSYLTIEKSGYFNGYKFVNGISLSKDHVRVQMVDRTKVSSFDAADRGDINIDGGATILIPANGIKKASGGAYTGNVNVYAHWYDPSSTNVTATMPGDLRALNLESQLVQLATYGMLGVELESDSGEKLQLADGTEATITLPIPSSLQSDAPTDIPLWHFDEASGYWMEDGTASIEGSAYVGTVSHFSFWNCDAPFPLVELAGSIVDPSGNPLAGYSVCIKVVSSAFVGYDYTNADGAFGGKVPSDEELIFQVKDQCYNVIFEYPFGPINEDTDLGPLTVSIADNQLLITAQLLDCNNMPLTSGYAIVQATQGYYQYMILEPDADGMVSSVINTCNNFDINFYAYDPTNLVESEEIIITNPGNGILELGQIVVCESIEEYITFNIESGETNLISDPSLVISDGSNYVIDGFQSGGQNNIIRFNAIINDVVINTAKNAERVTGQGFNANNLDYFSCNVANNNCGDLFFTVTNTGNIGDFIEGTFTGSIQTELNENGATIEGAFRIKLDNAYNTGSISGQVWNDDNSNGIRDNGETPVEGVGVYLLAQDSIGVNIPNTYVETDANGAYIFEGLIPYDEYQVLIGGGNYPLSAIDQGGDDTVDSDFNPATSTTEFISVADGENVINVDAGVLPAAPLTCNATVDCEFIIVDVTGGTAPYTFETTGNGLVQQGGPTINVLSSGTYVVTVTDANGNTCESIVDVYLGTVEISGTAWIDDAGAINNLYDAATDMPLANVSLSLVDLFGNQFDIATTSNTGQYSFFFQLDDVAIQNLYVQVDLPMGYELLELNVGNDDNIDNDIDPMTNQSEALIVPYCGDEFYTVDIGFKAE